MQQLKYITIRILVLLILILAYMPISHAALICTDDTGGANDDNQAQTDVTQLCLDLDNLPTSYIAQFNWDEEGLSGNNTGDACLLFDTDGDANINFAICLQVQGNPLGLNAGPNLFICNNSTSDRCSGAAPLTSVPDDSLTSCSVAQDNTDPFDSTAPNGPGSDFPVDTVGTCTVDVRDIPAGVLQVNICSFPSQNPNSNPADCIGVIGGGFINIIKDAVPDDNTQFNFTITNSLGNAQNISITGAGGQIVSLETGTYSIAETVPTPWGLVSASCNDGSSTGTNPITGIVINPSQTVECTFSNRLSADLSITKDDSSITYTPGGIGTYILTITNNGPADVTAATIEDLLPNGVTLSSQWTCSATAGSSCSAANGGSIGGSTVSLTADIINAGVITVNVPVQFSANMGDY